MSVEKGMTPQPNTEYLDNGHRYRTDEHGRTVITEGWLKEEMAPRNPAAQRKAGGDDRKGTDHGGHGGKASSGFTGELVNITAQEGDLNTGGTAKFGELSDEERDRINRGEHTDFFNVENYRDMERFLDYQVSQGKRVYFQKRNYFEGNSKRPSHYVVFVTVYDADGKSRNHSFTFYNTDKEGRKGQRDRARRKNEKES